MESVAVKYLQEEYPSLPCSENTENILSGYFDNGE